MITFNWTIGCTKGNFVYCTFFHALISHIYRRVYLGQKFGNIYLK